LERAGNRSAQKALARKGRERGSLMGFSISGRSSEEGVVVGAGEGRWGGWEFRAVRNS
jgi:hypothetical protein